MSGFFDEPSTTGTNRAAPPTDCPTCGGDRLVPVVCGACMEDPELMGQCVKCRGTGEEGYRRCDDCNPAPTTGREPVTDARWKNYDR